jgi:hypothetical protein
MAAESHRRWTLVRVTRLVLAASLLAVIHELYANNFDCVVGNKVTADLGDGVRLQSCSWEKVPGTFVRTGPLQLIKNGILILKLATDRDGRLQGEYSTWDDHGIITENGHYRDGQKEGEWRLTDEQGNSRLLTFAAGVDVTPESTGQ